MEDILNFTHLILVGFVALFPPVNPLGTAIIVDPLLHSLDDKSRKAASFKVAMYCFMICVSTIVIGTWLLKLFGISLPVVQLAGGILICKMGWEQLSSGHNEKESDQLPDKSSGLGRIQDILFYPLAFPLTTGAGTISVLLTLSAHAGADEDWQLFLMNTGALLVAIVLMSILIYLSYAYTPALLRRLGPRGEQIVNRLSAFLVFCVGIQIAVGGITNLVHHYKLTN